MFTLFILRDSELKTLIGPEISYLLLEWLLLISFSLTVFYLKD